MTWDGKLDGVDIICSLLILFMFTFTGTTIGFKLGKEVVYDAIRKDPGAFVAAVSSLGYATKEQEELKKLIMEMKSGGK